MIINNEDKLTLRKTILWVPHPHHGINTHVASEVLISGRAVAMIYTMHSSAYNLKGLKMTKGSETQLVSNGHEYFTIMYDDSTEIDPDSIFDVSRLWECSINATNPNTKVVFGDVLFGSLLNFKDGHVNIHGAI